MNRPSFFEGVGVALIVALVSAAGIFTLSSVFFSATPIYLLTAIVSLAYIAYLLARSGEKTGRASVVLLWFVVTVSGFVFIPSLFFFVLLQLGLIWLVRSLYYHNSIVAALLDLGLFALSLMISAWSWFNTQSVFVSVWSFFLTQALFVLIPWRGNPTHGAHKSKACHATAGSDRFETAYRAAESAVRKLATH